MEKNIELKIRNEIFNIDTKDILQRIYASEDSTIVICGTLITGYGNRYSDLDVHVITEKPIPITQTVFEHNEWVQDYDGNYLKSFSLQNNSFLKSSWNYWQKFGFAVDVKYWSHCSLKKLLDKMQFDYDYAQNNVGYLRFPQYMVYGIGDNTVLSKIYDGMVIKSANQKYYEIIKRFDRSKYCYLAYRYHMPSYNEYRDIIGSFLDKDYTNSVRMTENYSELAMWSFSHLLGYVTTNRKWIMEVVDRITPDFGSIAAEYKALNYMEKTTDRNKIDYIKRSLNLVDDIFRQSFIVKQKDPTVYNTNILKIYWNEKKMIFDKKFIDVKNYSQFEFEWHKRTYQDCFISSADLMIMHEKTNLNS